MKLISRLLNLKVIIQKKFFYKATSRLVPTCQFMLLGGLTSLAVGFLCPIMNLPSNLFNWTYLSTHFHTLLPTSLASLASALLLLVAVKFTGKSFPPRIKKVKNYFTVKLQFGRKIRQLDSVSEIGCSQGVSSWPNS